MNFDMSMILLGIVYAFIFIVIFNRILVKHAWIAYLLTIIVELGIIVLLVVNRMMGVEFPGWVLIAVGPLYRGSYVTVLFAIVAYLGVLKPNTKKEFYNKAVRYLMSVRGEISIVAAIMTFLHNLAFGLFYFPALFNPPKEHYGPAMMAATFITIVLILLLIPLTITSFRFVRKRMKPLSWKRLQRLAYPFYVLLYAHIMVVLIGGERVSILSAIAYTLIFVPYFIWRINAAVRSKSKQAV